MSTEHVETADVVVVGGGPGGAVLSYLLARSGVEVALVERAATFDREFRGFGYTPGAVELFAQMDLLPKILRIDHDTIRHGEFTLYGRPVSVLDFSVLDTDYQYALLMEQPPLLELLVDEARAYDGFSFFPATTVTDLVTEEAGVVGVRAHDRANDRDIEFRGSLVVGADGRFSTVRSNAGIDPGLSESALELVWFKLPSEAVGGASQGRIERDGLLVYFGVGGGELQVGWFIEKGTYPELRAAGIDAFCDRLAAIDPRIEPALDAHLTSFSQCSLLDISPGIADEWTRDGLLLIGDAAHVASPIGAQGNALAIQDAAVAHETITDALEREGATGDGGDERDGSALSAASLASYESRRRPAIEEIIGLQRRSERSLSLFVKHGDKLPASLITFFTVVAAAAIPRSRLLQKAIERFAFGPERVTVETSRFVD
ncbi:FAD-dependent monooxygenase [Haloferax namakaokahaiae]|uniref:FAD-dependent monooxygenase n=1 Tax=Haloferax namakaokahaiae TaxID=1748331 RepID=A0ABD5ZF66_9EURY